MLITRRSILAAAIPPALAVPSSKPFLRQVDVFRSGEDGYHTYRIPALLIASDGTLLAFCEGRRNSSTDHGDIDLLVKSSSNQGASWSSARLVADHGPDTIGNPCPVVDRAGGRIWMALTGNPAQSVKAQISRDPALGTRTVWMTHSDDHGRSWATPTEITKQVKKPNWTWYATGPGTGIQLASGRLLFPCDHHEPVGSMIPYSHCFFSDDHGATWQLGENVAPHTLECMAVQLADGSLLLNARQQKWLEEKRRYWQGDPAIRRITARSFDGGATWPNVREDPALIEPACQGSIIRAGGRKRGERGRLWFANPASMARENLSLRVSEDEGKSWKHTRPVNKGMSAYSSLCAFADGTIGCLYERGDKTYHERITFAHTNLKWVSHETENQN